MRIIKLIAKSILAGVLIALAGIVYTKCTDKVVGSFLFSFGLCLVLILEAKLFTGVIGYCTTKKDFLDAGVILCINLISAFLVGLLFRMGSSSDSAKVIADAKLDVFYDTWWITLLKSIGCGICIYGAVEGYKKTKSFIPVILGVMVFILAGFNHCIADAFYIGASPFYWINLVYLLLVAVGNAIGSILIRLLQRGWKDEVSANS